ncbi:MAG TPA: hypothetical protein DDW50_04865 [Firmicutes bacterium]|nr:hypothetical protein [Bacillota bacterium]
MKPLKEPGFLLIFLFHHFTGHSPKLASVHQQNTKSLMSVDIVLKFLSMRLEKQNLPNSFFSIQFV